MESQIQRVTLTGVVQEITFPNICGKYLVKNFTNDNIFVSFKSALNENASIKIAKDHGQVCVINENYSYSEETKTNKIYVKGTGEIEVQQLCF